MNVCKALIENSLRREKMQIISVINVCKIKWMVVIRRLLDITDILI